MEDTTPVNSPVSALGTVDEAVTGLALLTLTPSVRTSRRLSVRGSVMQPKRLFSACEGYAPVAGGRENTALEDSVAADAVPRSRLPPPWTTDEIRALVSFLLLYTE